MPSSTLLRAALALTATGIVSAASIRHVLEEGGADVMFAVAYAFYLTLILIATLRHPPRWAPLLGFAFAASPLAAWALFGFYALFFAATEGAERALIADLAGERLRGRAFGAFHGAVGLAALPASILFGLWWKLFGPTVAFLIGAALSLAATATLLAFRRTLATPAPE